MGKITAFEPLKDPSVKALAELLAEKGGVLFIGPGMALYKDSDEPVLNKFLEKIPGDYGMDVTDEEKKDLRYILQKAVNSNNGADYALSELKKSYARFFKENFNPDKLYEIIAQLNFNLIINTNPDKEILKHLPAETGFAHYNCSGVVTADAAALDSFSFTGGKKLVYNIFGDIDQPDSVPLTESDFISLVRNVNGMGARLPAVITNLVRSDVPLVFLGFDFSNWHYKILLKVVELDKKLNGQDAKAMLQNPVSVHTKATYPAPQPSVRSFYEGEFRMGFKSFQSLSEYILSLRDYTPGNKKAQQHQRAEPLITTLLYNSGSAEDRYLKDLVVSQLKSLRGTFIDEPWTIDLVTGGKSTTDVLEERLSRTELLIPLISADFNSNDDLTGYLKELNTNPAVTIVPVFLRTFNYEVCTYLQNMEILPQGADKKPYSLGTNKAAVDDNAALVCRQVQQIIEQKSNP